MYVQADHEALALIYQSEQMNVKIAEENGERVHLGKQLSF